MDHTLYYSTVHYAIKCRDTIHALPDAESKKDNVVTALDHINKAMALLELKTEVDVVQGDTSPDQKVSKLFNKAYDILKHETKPGPSLLQNKLKLTSAKAIKLFQELVDSGKIVKGQRAEEPPTKTTKKATKKKAPANPNAKIMELIHKMPQGDDLLVPAHLQPLLILDEPRRAEYLTGIKLEELIDTEDIARGTLHGVNTTLVDQIDSLTKSRPRKVKDNELIVANKKGNKTERRYYVLRRKFVNAIPEGKALYKHMITRGFTMRVLSDLKDIALAVAKGQG